MKRYYYNVKLMDPYLDDDFDVIAFSSHRKALRSITIGTRIHHSNIEITRQGILTNIYLEGKLIATIRKKRIF